ncbi:MerR family transcriptional regulator [Terrimonas sp.]|uniref:MerR family transcriptional regulator n=1 Tax=Terrimonas sp. TaxID=1914338 RepID=UPI001F0BD394|nr:MerR family transcriptional regulator [Terrimonas sp.]
MFKQLDLFAGFPDEHPKKDDKRAEVVPASIQEEEITAGQDDIAIAETEEIFFEGSINGPGEGDIAAEEETDIFLVEATPVADNILTEERKTKVASKPVKGKRGRKSLKEMEGESDFISIPEDEVLFKKQYYSIGEVSAMFQLNTSLLRYWETEFDILKPRKNRKGDRHFRPEDIKNLYLIHHLLRQRKYTIEGAKDYLKKNKSKAQQNFELIQRLQKLKGFLLELKAGL